MFDATPRAELFELETGLRGLIKYLPTSIPYYLLVVSYKVVALAAPRVPKSRVVKLVQYGRCVPWRQKSALSCFGGAIYVTWQALQLLEKVTCPQLCKRTCRISMPGGILIRGASMSCT
jgi:hypothetical protein